MVTATAKLSLKDCGLSYPAFNYVERFETMLPSAPIRKSSFPDMDLSSTYRVASATA